MTGVVLTVNVAAVVATLLPHVLVKRARYFLPLSAAAVVNESVVLVAPPMSVKVMPSVLTCHCTVGDGLPLAAAVKLARAPAHTVVLTGLVVTAGAVLTVNVAAVVATLLPQELVKRARYFLPLSAAAVVNE